MEDDNTIFIGKKPVMNYVLAVVTQFNNGSNDVLIKARGKAISRAVDVAEIVRRRYIRDATIKDVRLNTETLKGEGGRDVNVSSIEIQISRQAPQVEIT
ncbi:MAG: DNA-binding protein Alba [Euryarchaeota archaeon]|nr:DNA-binding protein Alba [Euryarchaeota archaeon]